jgi:uncharacterized protein YndB with AHSA1/START domain
VKAHIRATIASVAAPLTVKLSRMVEASPQRVFEAMTDPEQVAEWWGPEGFTCPEVTLDPRVGGAYRIAMQPPEGELFHLAGEYVEVEPASRLAYTRFAGSRPTPTTARRLRAWYCTSATARPRSSSPSARSQPRRDARCIGPVGPTPSLA